MTFGEKLQCLRKSNAMSQDQLAKQIQVSRQAVSKWELDSCLPDIENVLQISNLFNVSTDYLLKNNVDSLNKQESSAIPLKREGLINQKIMIISGIGFILLSTISLFIIWLLSKIYPAPIVYFNITTQKWKVGFDNFVWVHGLENFILICGIIFIIGLLLLINKLLKKSFNSLFNYFKSSKTKII